MRFFGFLLIALFYSSSLSGQFLMHRADANFEDYAYITAIRQYEKLYKRNPQNAHVIRNLVIANYRIKNTLEAEETLPSIRELASFLKINPNTVARAYRELSQGGVIGGRAGKGFWVAKTRQTGEEKMAILKEEFLRFLEKAVAMVFASDVIKTMIDDFFAQGKENRGSND